MKIKFQSTALRDLDSIKDHLESKSPTGLANVLADIEAVIRTIPFPRGTQSPIDDAWEKLSRKYKYRIVYCIRGDTIHILCVHHGSRAGIDYSAIDLENLS